MNDVNNKHASRFVTLTSILLLTACGGSGGGGGGGGNPPPVNNAPTASNLSIADDNGGDALSGDNLTGSYTFADAEGDAEGTSRFRWLRDGAAIGGATALTYTLASDDVSAEITFEVTPVASAGTTTGNAVTSAGVTVVSVDLASLSVTGADLEQAFDAAQTSYTAVVGFLIDAVRVDATAAAGSATIQINGAALPGGGLSIDLAEGDNVITITVSDGSSTRDYTLTVTRQTAAAFAQDAYLKASNAEASDRFGFSVALPGCGRRRRT